uniref:Centromere protein S n=1 Tax=Anolis carolinensis TaxID=28377 RepID=A0A803TLQ4_ANOCA
MERRRSEGLDSDETQRLRAAVHYTVGCLCEEVSKDKETQFSKQAIACISEITFRQCEMFAKDLEMFARHAKRTTVNVEDVKLLARRSNSLGSADLGRDELLAFLSGLVDRASRRHGMPLSKQEKVVRSPREERVPFFRHPVREKAPCKNFFWKTFSSC